MDAFSPRALAAVRADGVPISRSAGATLLHATVACCLEFCLMIRPVRPFIVEGHRNPFCASIARQTAWQRPCFFTRHARVKWSAPATSRRLDAFKAILHHAVASAGVYS
eukprot:4832784-Pleurochrysis_carterae.AAC.2